MHLQNENGPYFIYTFYHMKKATTVEWQHHFENIILIHVITKAKEFFHSFN